MQGSSKFFGNKKFTDNIYQIYLESNLLTNQQIQQVFRQEIHAITHNSPSEAIMQIYCEFINLNLRFGRESKFQFQKLSAWIEIASHIFFYSFKNWLKKDQSFEYFTDVLVRHSLFRPPHSIYLFNYEDIKVITDHWIGTFCRYYDEYSTAISTDLNQILLWSCTQVQTRDKQIKGSKIIGKQIFDSYLKKI